MPVQLRAAYAAGFILHLALCVGLSWYLVADTNLGLLAGVVAGMCIGVGGTAFRTYDQLHQHDPPKYGKLREALVGALHALLVIALGGYIFIAGHTGYADFMVMYAFGAVIQVMVVRWVTERIFPSTV